MISEYNKFLKIINDLPYREYLKTEHWNHFRKKCLEQFQECQLCNQKEDLKVHHKTYENKGRETFRDIIVLCSYCHEKTHCIFKKEDNKTIDIQKYELTYFALRLLRFNENMKKNILLDYVVSKNKNYNTPYNREKIQNDLQAYLTHSEYILGDCDYFINNSKFFKKILKSLSIFSFVRKEFFNINEDWGRYPTTEEFYEITKEQYYNFEDQINNYEEAFTFLNILLDSEITSITDDQVLSIVIERIEEEEMLDFLEIYNKVKDYEHKQDLFKKVIFGLQSYYEKYFEEKKNNSANELL